MGFIADAAVVHDPGGEFSIEKIEYRELGELDVLVDVKACGICHTDFIAQHIMPLPAILGHEGSGVVEKVGPAVRGFKPGDKVIVSYPSCGICSGCEEGMPYHCDHHMKLGFSGRKLDGSSSLSDGHAEISADFFQQSCFSTRAVVQERNLVKVNGHFDFSILAAIPCGVQTGAGAVLNSFSMNAHHSIAVFGAGAVGLSAVMAAKMVGVSPIIAIDVIPARLELAKELGATHTLNAMDGDIATKIAEICRGGVKFSIETSGNETALNDAISCLSAGGECGMVISPNFGKKYPFSPTEIFKGARSVRGIIQGSSVPRSFLPKILEWYREGRFPVDRLIKTYKFSDINYAAMEAKSGLVIKPVLVMGD